MMSDSGPQPNAQMLRDHVSMVFLHHLMDAPLVRREKKLDSLVVGRWDGQGIWNFILTTVPDMERLMYG